MMRRHQHLYEINTRLFIRRLSERYGKPVTLATVPSEEWQRLARRGFDLVWLMGVWQRSPGARQKALLHPAMRREYDKVLPGWTEEDIAGSPYAVLDYSLDPALGSEDELAYVKSRLKSYGINLLLDFVPNHLAFDHPWTVSQPALFVKPGKADLSAHPDWFFQSERRIYFAHGRDPYFPPWTDTVQVNFYSPELREALINELLRIAEVADGVRCDMAMLGLNEVFEKVWGNVLKDYPRPKTEFWSEAISRVRQRLPYFLFIAEAYWGYGQKLQELGFDFTYDKPLYDSLRSGKPVEVLDVLKEEDVLVQQHSVRFIENHDEKRAVAAFGRERSLAAAAVVATLPSMRMFHDGQSEGRSIRVPVQMAREPEEPIDAEVLAFYRRLESITGAGVFHEGAWSLLETTTAWGDNESYRNLLAWTWQYEEQFKVVVVNYSGSRSQGRLKLPSLPQTPARLVFYDEMAGVAYIRNTSELLSDGLYVDLGPYKVHLFDVFAD